MSSIDERIEKIEADLRLLKAESIAARPTPASGQVWRHCDGGLHLLIRNGDTNALTWTCLNYMGVTGKTTTQHPVSEQYEYVGMIWELLK